MASYEVLVPPLDGYEQMQEAICVEPDELAVLGLHMIGRTPSKYVKTCDWVPDYGYVMPVERQGKPYYLRGIYLHEKEVDPLDIPRRPEEVAGHLVWHQGELQRLQQHGIEVPAHLPVVVKDEDRWGKAGFGLFTLSEAVEGTPLQQSLDSWRAKRQTPALQVLGKLFSYYVDPNRPAGVKPMRDVCFVRQYIGQTLVDLDPLIANNDFPNEFAHLSSESGKLRSREGKELHNTIHTEWLRRLDAAIDAR